MPKRFGLPAHAIKRLVPKLGYCFATDRITVDGQPVRFMYRELSDNWQDSGWRFFAGDETQDYANDPKNLELYDVNTIANYDPDIIPYLDASAYSAFERHSAVGQFVPTGFPG